MSKISDLANRYPHIKFDDLRFGIECGVGWVDIIDAFCTTADHVIAVSGGVLQVLQLKQKMGGLRIYFNVAGIPQSDCTAIDEACWLAEARSSHVCEHCGRRGRLTYNGLFYATLCGKHAAEADAEPVVPTPISNVLLADTVVPYDPDLDPFMVARSA